MKIRVQACSYQHTKIYSHTCLFMAIFTKYNILTADSAAFCYRPIPSVRLYIRLSVWNIRSTAKTVRDSLKVSL